jgi:hypothetical protein
MFQRAHAIQLRTFWRYLEEFLNWHTEVNAANLKKAVQSTKCAIRRFPDNIQMMVGDGLTFCKSGLDTCAVSEYNLDMVRLCSPYSFRCP